MKTAEEWSKEIPYLVNLKWTPQTIEEWLVKIQQDARHSALIEAAELCAMAKYGSEYRPTKNPSHIWKYTDEMEKAILALRDKKES